MTITADTSYFCFMQDVADLGVEVFCDQLERLGVGGATVAVHYHASRDMRPQTALREDGRGTIIDLLPGASYFPANPQLYPAAMPPWSPFPFNELDTFAQLRAACDARGLSLTAWTVFGFDERLGRAFPELSQENAFGDRHTSDLCPANPTVREGFVALARDVASRNPDRLLAESLHFQGTRLSRTLFELDPLSELALGLCFCRHCRAAAESDGIDSERVARWARACVRTAAFSEAVGVPGRLDTASLLEEADGELDGYLTVRSKTVEAAAKAVARAVKAGNGTAAGRTQLYYMDQAGAEPALLGPDVVSASFRSGVAPSALKEICDGYEVLGYRTSAEHVEDDLAAYRSALTEGYPVRLALRPGKPDCSATDNLVAKLRSGVDRGVAGFDFYHLGLVSRAGIERVTSALEQVGLARTTDTR